MGKFGSMVLCLALLVFLIPNSLLASTTHLGISPDGKYFTINDVPTYLNGISYYGVCTINEEYFENFTEQLASPQKYLVRSLERVY